MSDQIETPGTSAASVTPTTSSAGGSAGARPEGSPSSGDYLTRIQTDAGFATQEVTKHQSRADRAEQEQKNLGDWIGGLSAYREKGLSGADLAGHLDTYSRVIGNPEMAKMIEQYIQTNEVPGVADPEADVYLTDEQKEIRELRGELQSIRSNQSEHTSAQGRSALIGHLDKLQLKWGLKDEDFDTVRNGLLDQANDWRNQGLDGEKAMKTLMSPSGFETVELMMAKKLGHDGLIRIAKAQLLRDEGVRAELTTDGPSGAPTRGGEPPPVFNTGIEALRAIRANPDLADGIRY